MVPCNSRCANENAWRFSHRKMFISQHLMFRSFLSETVWFKFHIISSWRVPVWTVTSRRGTFLSIVLWEDAAIGGKIKSVARKLRRSQLPYGLILFAILLCLPRQSNHQDCLYPEKVWPQGTQPKYLSKLTFALSALSIWVRTCFLF